MESRGTILYIGGFELPDRNAAAQRVISNGKLLRDLGYEVIYDGITKENLQASEAMACKNYFRFKTYTQRYPLGFWNWFKYVIQFKRYVTLIERHGNIKIIIGYNLPSFSLFRLLKYCKKKNIKLIADCTEWYMPPGKGSFIKKEIKKLDIYLRMKVIHPRVNGIIAISKYLFNFYDQKKVKCLLLPPLVDIDDEKWNPISSNGLTNNERTIIYAGSISSFSDRHRIKDRLDLIVKSFCVLRKEGVKFIFNVVGMYKSEFMDFFPELISEADILCDDIIFHGRLTHIETLNLLKRNDYFIFVRDNKILNLAGFPTKFVEAITCGIPVITDQNGNLVGFLKTNNNGFLVDMTDCLSIAHSIKKAISIDESELDTIKKNCLESKLFDYRHYSEEVGKFLDEIILEK